MSEVLVLSGKSGHGKDYIANLIKNKLIDSGYSAMIIHYADLLKYYLKTYYDWDGNKDNNGRYLLQHVGSDIIRKNDSSYWVSCVARFIATLKDEFDIYIIPDARFINEIEIIREYFPQAKTIRVERYNDDGSPYINPNLTIEQLEHTSETELDNYNVFDYILENKYIFDLPYEIKIILEDMNFSI